MNKILIALLVLAVVAIGTYLLVFRANTGNITPAYAPTEQVAPAETPTTLTAGVNIKNFSFTPIALTIKVGTKVTWTNNDSASHTVTSDSGDLLNSGTLVNGQSFSYTFNEIGTFDYHCVFHSMMKGMIVVTN